MLGIDAGNDQNMIRTMKGAIGGFTMMEAVHGVVLR